MNREEMKDSRDHGKENKHPYRTKRDIAEKVDHWLANFLKVLQ